MSDHQQEYEPGDLVMTCHAENMWWSERLGIHLSSYRWSRFHTLIISGQLIVLSGNAFRHVK